MEIVNKLQLALFAIVELKVHKIGFFIEVHTIGFLNLGSEIGFL